MIYTVTVNPALDYVMHPLTLDMGYTNRSSTEELRVGGNGINISTILKELQVPNCAMGIVAGFTGNYLVDTLQSQGITSNFVRLDQGFTRINVKLQGIVMTMVNGMGPVIPQEKVEELLERMSLIEEGATVVLTGSIPSTLPDDLYVMIMERLHHKGIRFVVDAPGALLLRSLHERPYLIKPNNHELGRLFDVRPELPEECLPYARLLQERGARNVVVSCGKYGAAFIDEEGGEHIVVSPPCRLVNATGAGDSMVAGFLAQMSKGADYEQAIRFAVACGSATAASRGLANAATIQRFYDNLQQVMEAEAETIAERLEAARQIGGKPEDSRPEA